MTYRHFSIEEREAIQRGLWEKRSMRDMALSLRRSHASISREIRKNIPAVHRRYTPRLAEARANAQRHRKHHTRLKHESIRSYVTAHLKAGWSPEQIAGRIERETTRRISYEAIYQFVYMLSRHGGEDLRPFLKRRHKARLRKGARKWQHLKNPHKPSIEERPLVVEKRSRIGDWEGDLVVSHASSVALVTLVERKSGYVCIEKIHAKTAEATAGAMTERLRGAMRYTLTLDNGTEHNHWREIEKKARVTVFFAHPYHSWERGTNENTNGLVRWYLPKGTDFATISEREIREIEHALNGRPRKRLGYQTPHEVFMGSGALRG